MIHYLKEVVEDHFTRVYLACYARPAEHTELEAELKRTKACTHLMPSHLNKILSDDSWNFSNTWGIPSDDQLDELTNEIKNDLKFVYQNSPVKDAELRLLTSMVNSIKNIEIVSVVLAFLIPGKYCIIAPPPEHMIGFRRRSDKLETLQRYFLDYQTLAKKYNIKVVIKKRILFEIWLEYVLGHA